MTDSERLAELRPEFVTKAVLALRTIIDPEDIPYLRSLYDKYQAGWFNYTSILELPCGSKLPRGHFDAGLSLRNYLRDSVCRDDSLPSGNWDDYYLPLLEMALGFRSEGLES